MYSHTVQLSLFENNRELFVADKLADLIEIFSVLFENVAGFCGEHAVVCCSKHIFNRELYTVLDELALILVDVHC